MGIVRIALIWVLSFFYAQGSIAAIDPVAWSLQPATGFSPIAPGGNSTVLYTLFNNLPFITTINTTFTKSPEWFFIQDSCNGAPLLPGGFCMIAITFLPQAEGTSFIQLTYGYHNNRIPLHPLFAVAQRVTPPTPNCISSPTVTLPLPTNVFQFSDNIVQYTFTNTCPTNASIGLVNVNATLGNTLLASNAQVTLTVGKDNCSNKTLSPFGSCTVSASVIPQTTGTLTVTAGTVSQGVPVSAATSAPVSANNYQHTVTFVNQCPFPVWYGVANDSPNKLDPTSPASPDDYLLNAQVPGQPPTTKSLTFPVEYIGEFFARTGCQTIGNQLFCQTAQCTPDAPPNGGRCLLNQEPSPPFTKIEMNFFNTAQGDGSFDGVYDISLIEGFNVPVEMKALGPQATVTPFPPANNTAFQCGGAGAPFQAANPPTPDAPLGSCPWVVTPPNNGVLAPQFFNFVTDGDEAAGQNNCSCTAANPVCGIAFKAADPQKGNLIMFCGQLLGTWALKTLCTQPFATTVTLTPNNDTRLRYNCDEDISTVPGTQPGYTAGTTLSDIYGCNFNPLIPTVLNSCYKSGVSNNLCCGAVDWNTTNPYVTAQDTQASDTNSDWGSPTSVSPIVPSPYETIVWYKNACPTAYSYPFDDHSGSFFCKQSPSGTNVKMNYQVVFCPGGLTGH